MQYIVIFIYSDICIFYIHVYTHTHIRVKLCIERYLCNGPVLFLALSLSCSLSVVRCFPRVCPHAISHSFSRSVHPLLPPLKYHTLTRPHTHTLKLPRTRTYSQNMDRMVLSPFFLQECRCVDVVGRCMCVCV